MVSALDIFPEITYPNNNAKRPNISKCMNIVKGTTAGLLIAGLVGNAHAGQGLSPGEIIMASYAIAGEAFNGGELGMRSIAEVIKNRRDSKTYRLMDGKRPKNLVSIICDVAPSGKGKQFDVMSASYDICKVKDSITQKVDANIGKYYDANHYLKEELAGRGKNLTKGATHFMNPMASGEKSKKWFSDNCRQVAEVWKHKFYKC